MNRTEKKRFKDRKINETDGQTDADTVWDRNRTERGGD